MRCFGRTQSLSRCRNTARIIFCATHRWQWLAWFVALPGILLAFFQLWGEIKHRYIDVSPDDIDFVWKPTYSDTSYITGDSLSDGIVSLRIKMVIENNGHKPVKLTKVGWCWFDVETECQIYQDILGPFSIGEFSHKGVQELPVVIQPSEVKVLFANVVMLIPWSMYKEVYRGFKYSMSNLEAMERLGDLEVKASTFLVIDDKHQIIGTLPFKGLVKTIDVPKLPADDNGTNEDGKVHGGGG